MKIGHEQAPASMDLSSWYAKDGPDRACRVALPAGRPTAVKPLKMKRRTSAGVYFSCRINNTSRVRRAGAHFLQDKASGAYGRHSGVANDNAGWQKNDRRPVGLRAKTGHAALHGLTLA
ncbi:hypothetical protein [Salinisphaera sp. Q1T1-3]|uniref:hypothetical protein n=1 Tax=Salinisphaera sp. Q1T1-3 TaxID=2321229 RepID=UPI0011C44300|nr:hypothetical protein [Salinisphaera sp. Q1T1-3]